MIGKGRRRGGERKTEREEGQRRRQKEAEGGRRREKEGEGERRRGEGERRTQPLLLSVLVLWG